MSFVIFISFVVLQRLSELFIAKRNEKWLLKNGAIEYGQKHYPFIISMHVLFIISMIMEYLFRPASPINYLFLLLFFILLVLKMWTISSLGKFWNTKIFRVPGTELIKKGLYRFIRHPNYIIVVFEMAIIPLVFHLCITAIIFSILNAVMLRIRIKEENKVWEKRQY